MQTRNLTPPYLSNVPDIRYFDLRTYHVSHDISKESQRSKGSTSVLGKQELPLQGLQEKTLTRRACLILCSDGLIDLYRRDKQWDNLKDIDIFERWIEIAVSSHSAENIDPNERLCQNHALRILRNALGGKDEERVSSMITMEMEERWMDDTTIIVEDI
jgi:pyruvate dehydrogenase phosphatase